MNTHRANIHALLRSLDAAFAAFESGQRGKLFDSRDSVVQLSQQLAEGGWGESVKLCDVTARLLGRVLRQGALDERAALSVVRELLALLEGQVARDPAEVPGKYVTDGAGGVFKVVNESRLGELLVRMGKLHPAQVQQALVLQRVSKDKRFGEVLIAMNAIDQRTLEEALEAQHSQAKAKPPQGAQGAGLRLAPLPDLPGAPPAPLPSGGVAAHAHPVAARPSAIGRRPDDAV